MAIIASIVVRVAIMISDLRQIHLIGILRNLRFFIYSSQKLEHPKERSDNEREEPFEEGGIYWRYLSSTQLIPNGFYVVRTGHI